MSVPQAQMASHPFDPQLGEIPIDGCVQRANAGFLAPGQTKLSVNVDNVATGSASTFFIPLPAPPTGKIWMITDLALSHTVSTGQRFAIVIGGVTVFSLPAHGSAAPDIMSAIETQIDCPGGLQPVLQVTGANTMNSFANLLGVYQNAGSG